MPLSTTDIAWRFGRCAVATPSPFHLKQSASFSRLMASCRTGPPITTHRRPLRCQSFRPAKDGGGRELVLMQWGLIPWFSKDGKPSYSTINARAEGVQSAASYREPFKTRRCIVPASGYFEWTGLKNDRQPHYFTHADGQPTALAGLWDRWKSKDKSETKETFAIVTTEPSKFAAQFHNRMPLVLEPDTWDLWIKGEPDAAAALSACAYSTPPRKVKRSSSHITAKDRKNGGNGCWNLCDSDGRYR
jgi:putative SOS response-associated peptidase YedK